MAGAVDGVTGGAAGCGAVDVDMPDGSTFGESGLLSLPQAASIAIIIRTPRFFIVIFRSKPEYRGRQPRFAGGPDLIEACDERPRGLRHSNAERRARLIDVVPMEKMLAIDDDQRIHRGARARPGLIDRHCVTVTAQQRHEARARRLD